jgi:hypothetical protein
VLREEIKKARGNQQPNPQPKTAPKNLSTSQSNIWGRISLAYLEEEEDQSDAAFAFLFLAVRGFLVPSGFPVHAQRRIWGKRKANSQKQTGIDACS